MSNDVRNGVDKMFSNFSFWLMQQPKEIQICWYLGTFIIFIVCIIYGMLQEPKEE